MRPASDHGRLGTKARSHPFLLCLLWRRAGRPPSGAMSMSDLLPPSEPLATSSEAPPPVVLGRISMQITIVVAVVIVAALYFGREVLIPITIALLLTFLL